MPLYCREYAAPELVETNRMSTKSDIYSLGVLIIEIVTGHNYASSDVRKLTLPML